METGPQDECKSETPSGGGGLSTVLAPDRLEPALGEPSSSRFRGDVPTQKGRKAVGHDDPSEGDSRGYVEEGSVMTHVGCPTCRLRFSAASAAYLVACPECGRPLEPIAGAERVVGFRLFAIEDAPQELPEAVAVSIRIPDPGIGPL
jgi:hypothetical protein